MMPDFFEIFSIMASLFGLQKMYPVVVKSCGHRMWSLVVSICDVTGGRYYSAASVV